MDACAFTARCTESRIIITVLTQVSTSRGTAIKYKLRPRDFDGAQFMYESRETEPEPENREPGAGPAGGTEPTQTNH